MADPDFKDKADKARLSGKGIKADLANLKDISFEDFSEQFLETKLFDHHKSWNMANVKTIWISIVV